MNNEFEASEKEQKANPLESRDSEPKLNLLDLMSNEENVGRHHHPYPYPFPIPRPHPSSHVGGTSIEVHDGKIVVHRN